MINAKKWLIDYQGLLLKSGLSDLQLIAEYLTKELPSLWAGVYRESTSHLVNLLQIIENDFVYYYDWYSKFEVNGTLEYDPKIEDRLVAAMGRSRKSSVKRDTARQ